jgi:hypothetical protein
MLSTGAAATKDNAGSLQDVCEYDVFVYCQSSLCEPASVACRCPYMVVILGPGSLRLLLQQNPVYHESSCIANAILADCMMLGSAASPSLGSHLDPSGKDAADPLKH